MKIILFYSSIGQGHISAARSIEKEIQKKHPGAQVVMKDIRDFMVPVKRMLDEKLYWFVVKNLPDLFDNMFIAMQEQGNKAGSLTWLPNDYPEMEILKYIKAQAPGAILATHYGSAQVLGTLREKGLIPGIKIGWLHTDYFEGYFPRISKRIDKTFLAHPDLKKRWISAGVDPSLIDITGMPVNVPADIPHNAKEGLRRIGLDPSVPTLTITGGKEGAVDFVNVVKSIARYAKTPIQMIAVCGKNDAQERALAKIRKKLPAQVSLTVMGFIPQEDLVSFVCASDLFITKAGGLSPAEAFTLGKPTILLNGISGHERENAELFARLNMAAFNRNIDIVGQEVQVILRDPENQASMLSAQKAYRDSMDIEKIVCFLLDPQIKARIPHSGFGAEKGLAVHNVKEALTRLEEDAPADMEILLSYASSMEDERIITENPFGHIAVRVGDTVYSANHLSKPSTGNSLLQHMRLDHYLFGIVPPSDNQVHTSTYGMSYGRDTLGFRIKGLLPASLERMHEEAATIEEEFRSGTCAWNRYTSNCADFVARILKSGGYGIETAKSPIKVGTMPLDIFEKVIATFEGHPEVQTGLVAYRRLPGAQTRYRFSRFPLSLWQPMRALMQVLKDASPDRIEQKVSRQLTGYMGDDHIYYEQLCARLSTSDVDHPARSSKSGKDLEHLLWEETLELVSKQTRRTLNAYREKTGSHFIDELSDLMKICVYADKIKDRTNDIFTKRPIQHHSRFRKLPHPFKRMGRLSEINGCKEMMPRLLNNKSTHLHF